MRVAFYSPSPSASNRDILLSSPDVSMRFSEISNVMGSSEEEEEKEEEKGEEEKEEEEKEEKEEEEKEEKEEDKEEKEKEDKEEKEEEEESSSPTDSISPTSSFSFSSFQTAVNFSTLPNVYQSADTPPGPNSTLVTLLFCRYEVYQTRTYDPGLCIATSQPQADSEHTLSLLHELQLPSGPRER